MFRFIGFCLMLVWGFMMVVDMYSGGDWKQDLAIVGILYIAAVME